MIFEVALLFWLFVKHFICDFPLQMTPWMYGNKGTYGHPGGLTHAYIHSCGTGVVVVVCLIAFGYPAALAQSVAMTAAIIDGLVHYHIDWIKVNIGKAYDLKPNNSEWFWVLLGADQLAHALTYFALLHFMPTFTLYCKGGW